MRKDQSLAPTHCTFLAPDASEYQKSLGEKRLTSENFWPITGPDTFTNVLLYEKDEESGENFGNQRKKSSSWRRLAAKPHIAKDKNLTS